MKISRYMMHLADKKVGEIDLNSNINGSNLMYILKSTIDKECLKVNPEDVTML